MEYLHTDSDSIVATGTQPPAVDEAKLERLEADFAAAADALAAVEQIAESPVTGEDAAVAIRKLTASDRFEIVAPFAQND